ASVASGSGATSSTEASAAGATSSALVGGGEVGTLLPVGIGCGVAAVGAGGAGGAGAGVAAAGAHPETEMSSTPQWRVTGPSYTAWRGGSMPQRGNAARLHATLCTLVVGSSENASIGGDSCGEVSPYVVRLPQPSAEP